MRQKTHLTLASSTQARLHPQLCVSRLGHDSPILRVSPPHCPPYLTRGAHPSRLLQLTLPMNVEIGYLGSLFIESIAEFAYSRYSVLKFSCGSPSLLKGYPSIIYGFWVVDCEMSTLKLLESFASPRNVSGDRSMRTADRWLD